MDPQIASLCTAALHTRDPQQVCVTASPQSGVRGFHTAASCAAAWAIWAMLGTLLGKLSQVYLGYNRQGGGTVREARIF